MGWVTVIAALFTALTEYLLLRVKSYNQDILYKSYEKQDSIIHEIETLRAKPSPDNQCRIDILLLRLQQERSRLADLSAISTQTVTQSASKNP